MPTRPLTPSRARIGTGGGSGGASPPERDVPFIVHRPGSQLGSMGACLDGIQYSLVDVAPTVAAMLRVPAPRHSAGTAFVTRHTMSRDESNERIDEPRTRAPRR